MPVPKRSAININFSGRLRERWTTPRDRRRTLNISRLSPGVSSTGLRPKSLILAVSDSKPRPNNDRSNFPLGTDQQHQMLDIHQQRTFSIPYVATLSKLCVLLGALTLIARPLQFLRRHLHNHQKSLPA